MIIQNSSWYKGDSVFSAWRKGDLVKFPSSLQYPKGQKFRLTSDGYEKDGKIICDTDRGYPVSYLKLIEKAQLVEDINGRKNIPCK